eukprot:19269-Heterococcus_DN1.PRE.3
MSSAMRRAVVASSCRLRSFLPTTSASTAAACWRRSGSATSALAVHSRWAAPQQRAMCSAAQAQQPSSSAHTQIRGDVLAPADIMVYQYKICPFCNKLKAVMDYLGVPYQTTEVNPLTKKEIKFSKDYKKVPIVRLDGQFLQDSPAIVTALLQQLKTRGAISQQTLDSFASPEALKWVCLYALSCTCISQLARHTADWADKQLAVLLFPNITRNFSESYQAFSYVQSVDSFSILDKFANQVLGSTAMWAAQGKYSAESILTYVHVCAALYATDFANAVKLYAPCKQIKKKYNITDEREALYTALKLWTAEIEVHMLKLALTT